MEDNHSTLNISVVVPLFNEQESIKELFLWIKRVMDEHQFTYEVLFINDGSTDQSWSIIEELHATYPQAKGIKFRRNYGKSLHYIVDSKGQWEMLSSPWTLICKIVRMKSLNFTE